MLCMCSRLGDGDCADLQERRGRPSKVDSEEVIAAVREVLFENRQETSQLISVVHADGSREPAFMRALTGDIIFNVSVCNPCVQFDEFPIFLGCGAFAFS